MFILYLFTLSQTWAIIDMSMHDVVVLYPQISHMFDIVNWAVYWDYKAFMLIQPLLLYTIKREQRCKVKNNKIIFYLHKMYSNKNHSHAAVYQSIHIYFACLNSSHANIFLMFHKFNLVTSLSYIYNAIYILTKNIVQVSRKCWVLNEIFWYWKWEF
jgi:hypothetical protein